MKKLFQFMFICGGLAVMNSCNNGDGCQDTVCQNGGICVEGDCQCPDGYFGPNCEIASFENGVFIVHEGAFGGGNASLSFFNKYTDVMSNGVFSSVNNNLPLGDVAQSMTIHEGKGYIVVNNSGKIEVVNLEDLTSIGTITGLTSPRYIAIVDDSHAYVSDLFSGSVSMFNPQTLTVTGSIAIPGQTEQLVVVNDRVIVAGTGANLVYKLNPSTNTVTDSVDVGEGPSNLAVDANGKVWVLTNGGFGNEVPKLVRIDPTNMSIELSLDFPSVQHFPGDLEIDGTGHTLYFIDGDVYRMDITATALPTSAFASGFTYAYKCGIDPVEDVVYVSDATDFSSNGKVFTYQSDGIPVDTFEVSVAPGEFAFTQ